MISVVVNQTKSVTVTIIDFFFLIINLSLNEYSLHSINYCFFFCCTRKYFLSLHIDFFINITVYHPPIAVTYATVILPFLFGKCYQYWFLCS